MYSARLRRSDAGYTLGQLNPNVNPVGALPKATFNVPLAGGAEQANLSFENRLVGDGGTGLVYSFRDNLTWIKGSHTLKAGAYYEWVNNSQPGNGDANGRLIPASWGANTTGNYFSDILTGNLAEYGEQSPNIVRDMAYNVFEAYVQDSWKASNRLTVDGGRVSVNRITSHAAAAASRLGVESLLRARLTSISGAKRKNSARSTDEKSQMCCRRSSAINP